MKKQLKWIIFFSNFFYKTAIIHCYISKVWNVAFKIRCFYVEEKLNEVASLLESKIAVWMLETLTSSEMVNKRGAFNFWGLKRRKTHLIDDFNVPDVKGVWKRSTVDWDAFTVQSENNTSARTSFCVRKLPTSRVFFRCVCAWILRSARTFCGLKFEPQEVLCGRIFEPQQLLRG